MQHSFRLDPVIAVTADLPCDGGCLPHPVLDAREHNGDSVGVQPALHSAEMSSPRSDAP